MYVCLRNFSFKRGEVWRFPILDHGQFGMVEVRDITYFAPLPRPRYFISAAGTPPYFLRHFIPPDSDEKTALIILIKAGITQV